MSRYPAISALERQAAALSRPGSRHFSAAASKESRVIEAVKKFVVVRKEELAREEDSSGDREKMLKALETEVSEATTWDQLGFEDMDKVEVLLEVEDEFGHVIPDDDADKISSVKETIEYLAKNNVE